MNKRQANEVITELEKTAAFYKRDQLLALEVRNLTEAQECRNKKRAMRAAIRFIQERMSNLP